jgi:phosphoribosylanthranilate isomerase
VLLWNGEPVASVLDLPWLSMDAHHWERAARTEGRVMLAGGLGPENVRAAIDAVDPWCVDASRSLELAPGVKDHDRVRAFVDAVRIRQAVRS